MKDVSRFIVNGLKPHKKTVIFCTALAVAAAALDTAAPVVLGRGFDVAGRGGALVAFGTLLAGWFIVRSVAERMRSYISSRGNVISQQVIADFSRKTMAEFLRKPLSFHYDSRRGDVSEALGKFSNDAGNLIIGMAFDLIPSLMALIAILGYVAFLDWRIAAALGVTIGVFLGYTYRMTPQILEMQKMRNAASRKSLSYGWDALSSVLVVKSTANEMLVADKLEQYSDAYVSTLASGETFDRKVFDVQNVIVAFGSLLAIMLAVIDFNRGLFSFGRVTIIVAYAFTIFGYVRYSLWQFRSLIRTTASYRIVQEMRASAEEDYAGGAHVDLRGGVEFRNVRFRYREDRPILEDVSFIVDPGQNVAIVGESGEGKTTLVDIIGRYNVAQSGTILFDGCDAKEINLVSLRQQMAYVPQDLTLFHESLGYNIRFGRPDATDDEVKLAAKRAHLEAFIDGLPEKYETVVGERGLKLSGGERQRVALARAFLRNPKILVLDEPTAHLDSKTEASIQTALEELMKGRTTFIIAHRLRTVRDADVILVLKDGRIAESGTHDELATKNGAYASLLKAQGGFLSPNETHL